MLVLLPLFVAASFAASFPDPRITFLNADNAIEIAVEGKYSAGGKSEL